MTIRIFNIKNAPFKKSSLNFESSFLQILTKLSIRISNWKFFRARIRLKKMFGAAGWLYRRAMYFEEKYYIPNTKVYVPFLLTFFSIRQGSLIQHPRLLIFSGAGGKVEDGIRLKKNLKLCYKNKSSESIDFFSNSQFWIIPRIFWEGDQKSLCPTLWRAPKVFLFYFQNFVYIFCDGLLELITKPVSKSSVKLACSSFKTWNNLWHVFTSNDCMSVAVTRKYFNFKRMFCNIY